LQRTAAVTKGKEETAGTTDLTDYTDSDKEEKRKTDMIHEDTRRNTKEEEERRRKKKKRKIIAGATDKHGLTQRGIAATQG
jgi:hypothetical protein